MLFKDQRVLVVGGSSGIGAATAASFAQHGAHVYIASRNKAKLDHVASQIVGKVETVVLDITHDEQVSHVLRELGEFDHVVVSAAQTATGPVHGLELEDAYSAMNSKFWGAYRVARAVHIREAGSLTLVSGFLSVRPSKSSVLQGAINAALESLGRGLALELSPIRVNVVSPGLIATELWANLDASARERMYESVAARLPAKRVGAPEDIANAVIYLASTRYATGSTVLVDGGGAIA
ncbi:short chain dehydrogenase [Silvimonas iriomotensis]|uniref:Short chain dehydrogenase n=3 Tax=Silvimonas TaxID=300264 RepID=A0ABQ2PAP7_9NEIS|nr:SDR family oxidoreductase [Silvimonas amylolytica]GGP22277.1 short chain dehydrogenase [Silvimonas iriomotensis]GGP27060.1 short chain dehydrogenase [Silvimonas amylolytica]